MTVAPEAMLKRTGVDPLVSSNPILRLNPLMLARLTIWPPAIEREGNSTVPFTVAVAPGPTCRLAAAAVPETAMGEA
jgi:hypothetical protein